MRECACGDELVEEAFTVVYDSHGSVVVTRGVPSLVCEMCAERSYTSETVGYLAAIRGAIRLPGVESVTVDYAKMVAYLTETGAIHAEQPEAVAVGASASP